MHSIAERAIEIATGLGASYADIRIIDVKQQAIETKNVSLARLATSESLGAGIRVLYRGGWGFASTQSLSKQGITNAVKRAVSVAKASASCVNPPITLAPEPVHRVTWQSPCIIDPFTISTEEKIGLLLECAKIMLAVKGVSLTQAEMSFTREHKLFSSSEGSEIDQTFIRSSCGIVANAVAGDDMQRRSWPNSFGGQHENAGWEMVGKWRLSENAQRVAEEAVALLTAPECPQGTADVIVGGSQLALQIHESCGHPSELDRALGHEANFAGTSFLTPSMLGKLQYGAPIVNIFADATAAAALGGFGFDDDGVQAQCVPLVKDGLFVGYLSSRDTAHLIGLERSGGALRAASADYQPIIRMTNISLQPGQAGSRADLIAATDNGILMDTNVSWSIDDKRYNFQFGTEAGYKIEHGRIVGLLKHCSYGGITTEFWNSCDAICGDSEYVDWGVPNCGKGQPVQTMWTGHGAAPARFRKIKVGVTR
jgi:TldD protein